MKRTSSIHARYKFNTWPVQAKNMYNTWARAETSYSHGARVLVAGKSSVYCNDLSDLQRCRITAGLPFGPFPMQSAMSATAPVKPKIWLKQNLTRTEESHYRRGRRRTGSRTCATSQASCAVQRGVPPPCQDRMHDKQEQVPESRDPPTLSGLPLRIYCRQQRGPENKIGFSDIKRLCAMHFKKRELTILPCSPSLCLSSFWNGPNMLYDANIHAWLMLIVIPLKVPVLFSGNNSANELSFWTAR